MTECTYWTRQAGRDADDNGFGASPWDFKTPEQAQDAGAKRDAEDEADPPCDKCETCLACMADDGVGP
jgi:hypothetical protein